MKKNETLIHIWEKYFSNITYQEDDENKHLTEFAPRILKKKSKKIDAKILGFDQEIPIDSINAFKIEKEKEIIKRSISADFCFRFIIVASWQSYNNLNDDTFENLKLVFEIFTKIGGELINDYCEILIPAIQNITEQLSHITKSNSEYLIETYKFCSSSVSNLYVKDNFKRVIYDYYVSSILLLINKEYQCESPIVRIEEFNKIADRLIKSIDFTKDNLFILDKFYKFSKLAIDYFTKFEYTKAEKDEENPLPIITFIDKTLEVWKQYQNRKGEIWNEIPVKSILKLLICAIKNTECNFKASDEIYDEGNYLHVAEEEYEELELLGDKTLNKDVLSEDKMHKVQPPEKESKELDNIFINIKNIILHPELESFNTLIKEGVILMMERDDLTTTLRYCNAFFSIVLDTSYENQTSITLPWKYILSSVLFTDNVSPINNPETNIETFDYIMYVRNLAIKFFINETLFNKEDATNDITEAIIRISNFAENSIYKCIEVIPFIEELLNNEKYCRSITKFSASIKIFKILCNNCKVLRAKEPEEINMRARAYILKLLDKALNINPLIMNHNISSDNGIFKTYKDLIFEDAAKEYAKEKFDLALTDYKKAMIVHNDLLTFIVQIFNIIRDGGENANKIIPIATLVLSIINKPDYKIYYDSTNAFICNLVKFTALLLSDCKTEIQSDKEDLVYSIMVLISKFPEEKTVTSDYNIYANLKDVLMESFVSKKMLEGLIYIITEREVDIDNPYQCPILHIQAFDLLFEIAQKNENFVLVLNFLRKCCSNSYSNCFKYVKIQLVEKLLRIVTYNRETDEKFDEIQEASIKLITEIGKKVLTQKHLIDIINTTNIFIKDDKKYRVTQDKNTLKILTDIAESITEESSIISLPSFFTLFKPKDMFSFTMKKFSTKSWSFVIRFILDGQEDNSHILNRDLLYLRTVKENKDVFSYINLYIEDLVLKIQTNVNENPQEIALLDLNKFTTLSLTFSQSDSSLRIKVNDKDTEIIQGVALPSWNEETQFSVYKNEENRYDSIVANISAFYLFNAELSEEEMKVISRMPGEFSQELPQSIKTVSATLPLDNDVTFVGEVFSTMLTAYQSVDRIGGVAKLLHLLLFSLYPTIREDSLAEKNVYINSVYKTIIAFLKVLKTQINFIENSNGLVLLKQILIKLSSEFFTKDLYEFFTVLYNIVPQKHINRRVLILKHIFLNTKLWSLFLDDNIRKDFIRDAVNYTLELFNTKNKETGEIMPKPEESIVSIILKVPPLWEYMLYMEEEYKKDELVKEICSNIRKLVIEFAKYKFTINDHEYIISFIERYKGRYGLECMDILYEIEEKFNINNKHFCHNNEVKCPFVSFVSTNLSENLVDPIAFEYLYKTINFICAMKYKFTNRDMFDIDKAVLQMILTMERKKKEKEIKDEDLINIIEKINEREEVKDTDFVTHIYPLICHLMICAKKDDFNSFIQFTKDNTEKIVAEKHWIFWLVYLLLNRNNNENYSLIISIISHLFMYEAKSDQNNSLTFTLPFLHLYMGYLTPFMDGSCVNQTTDIEMDGAPLLPILMECLPNMDVSAMMIYFSVITLFEKVREEYPVAKVKFNVPITEMVPSDKDVQFSEPTADVAKLTSVWDIQKAVQFIDKISKVINNEEKLFFWQHKNTTVPMIYKIIPYVSGYYINKANNEQAQLLVKAINSCNEKQQNKIITKLFGQGLIKANGREKAKEIRDSLLGMEGEIKEFAKTFDIVEQKTKETSTEEEEREMTAMEEFTDHLNSLFNHEYSLISEVMKVTDEMNDEISHIEMTKWTNSSEEALSKKFIELCKNQNTLNRYIEGNINKYTGVFHNKDVKLEKVNINMYDALYRKNLVAFKPEFDKALTMNEREEENQKIFVTKTNGYFLSDGVLHKALIEMCSKNTIEITSQSNTKNEWRTYTISIDRIILLLHKNIPCTLETYTEDEAEDNTEDNTEDDTEDNTEDNTKDDTEDNTEDNFDAFSVWTLEGENFVFGYSIDVDPVNIVQYIKARADPKYQPNMFEEESSIDLLNRLNINSKWINGKISNQLYLTMKNIFEFKPVDEVVAEDLESNMSSLLIDGGIREKGQKKIVGIEKPYVNDLKENILDLSTINGVSLLRTESRTYELEPKSKSKNPKINGDLFTILDNNAYSWSIRTNEITIHHSKEQQQTPKLVDLKPFARGNNVASLFTYDHFIYTVCDDCSVNKYTDDLQLVYKVMTTNGEYKAAYMNEILRLLVILSKDGLVIVINPFNGTIISCFKTMIENPVSLIVENTPTIIVYSEKEIEVLSLNGERISSLVMNDRINISTICSINLTGSHSMIAIFEDNNTLIIIDPIQTTDQTVPIPQTAELQMKLPFTPKSSTFNNKQSTIYAILEGKWISILIKREQINL